MKTLDIMAIPLTQGLFALVDGEDYERISKYKWYAHKWGTTYRAARNQTIRSKRTLVFMHREILNTPCGMETDHRNHCDLDNRKQNIRICTKSQNQANRVRCKKCSSQFKGVSWHKGRNKWQGKIMYNRKDRYLGYFVCEIEAAKAYDEAARELFGEYAYLNFPAKESHD